MHRPPSSRNERTLKPCDQLIDRYVAAGFDLESCTDRCCQPFLTTVHDSTQNEIGLFHSLHSPNENSILEDPQIQRPLTPQDRATLHFHFELDLEAQPLGVRSLHQQRDTCLQIAGPAPEVPKLDIDIGFGVELATDQMLELSQGHRGIDEWSSQPGVVDLLSRIRIAHSLHGEELEGRRMN